MPARWTRPRLHLSLGTLAVGCLVALLAPPARAVLPAAPAGPHPATAATRPVTTTILPGDRVVGFAATGDRSMVLSPPDPTARLLVQFRDPPLLAARRAGDGRAVRLDPTSLSIARAGMARDRDRLALDLAAVRDVRMNRTFQECFNGVAITVPRDAIDRVRALPYVQAVFPDDSVHATLDESVHLIGADQVWNQFGITGQGVVVAIIDTGIDYTHDALGGGFGPGFRVVAGWDFVNDDGDPMDDNLHGTHVAGIVGANGGGLRGVAPDVTFHAYKVLNQFGGGVDADVIAGVERAVDPDGDPLTDDHVDVINMSLAGPGDAGDPLAQACDIAAQAGVTIACAAGNNGRYLGIGSPAAAAGAITVGATDLIDHVARFSSRGPLGGSYALKPDVMAPGVAIVSSVPGNGVLSLSGTSMASPHVAGAAALLKQGHPDWGPGRIKAALMNTAVNVAGDAVTVGAGRISVPAAIAPGFLVEPPSLSIARPGVAGAPYPVFRPLRVTNVSNQPQTVSLSVVGGIPGLAVGVEPPALTLAPGDSTTATVTLTIDPAGIAFPDTLPYLIAGAVVATSGAITHRVPFGFVRAIEVTFRDSLPSFGLIHDKVHEHWSWIPPDGAPLALIRPGTYDVIAGFLPRPGRETAVIVHEGMPLLHDDSLSVTPDEATLPIEIQPVDEHGQALPVTLAEMGLWMDGVFAMRLPAIDGHMRSTPIGPDYHLEWDHFAFDPGVSFQESRGASRGLAVPTVFRNDPADIHRFPLELPVDPGDARTVFHYRWFGFGSFVIGFEFAYTGFENGSIEVARMLPHTVPSLSLGFSERMTPLGAANSLDPVAQTPILDVVSPGRVTGTWGPDPGRHVFDVSARRFRYDFTAGPPVWIGNVSFNATTVYVSSQFRELESRLFMSPLGGVADGPDPRFWVVSQGAVVDSGSIADAGQALPIEGEFRHALAGPGPHQLIVEAPPYTIGGLTGRVRVTSDIGADPNDDHLPVLRQCTVLADGAATDSVVFDQLASAELRIKAFDDVHLARLAAWAAPAGSEAWTPLGATQDTLLAAALPDTLDGWVALKVEAEDLAGNRFTWVADPAYHSTARLAAFVRAAEVEPSPGSVTLRWTLPMDVTGPFPVYRRGLESDWTKVGETTLESDGRVRFDDDRAAAGRRYTYAIGVPTVNGEAKAGATVVDVPGARPVLFGILPNPSPGNLRVSFSLGSNAPATLEVIDLAGRRLRRMEVGAMGAGEHGVDLGAGLELRSGVYWVRLVQSGVTQVMRAAVVR